MLQSGNPSLVFKKLPSASKPTANSTVTLASFRRGLGCNFTFSFLRRSRPALRRGNWFAFHEREILVRDDPFLEIDFPIRNRWLFAFGFWGGQAEAADTLRLAVFLEQIDFIVRDGGRHRQRLGLIRRSAELPQKFAGR